LPGTRRNNDGSGTDTRPSEEDDMISDERLKKVWEFAAETIPKIEDGTIDAEKADAKLLDLLSEPEGDCPADHKESGAEKARRLLHEKQAADAREITLNLQMAEPIRIGTMTVEERDGVLYVFGGAVPEEDAPEEEMTRLADLIVDFGRGRILKNRHGPTRPEEDGDWEKVLAEKTHQVNMAVHALTDVAQDRSTGRARSNMARVEAAKAILRLHGKLR